MAVPDHPKQDRVFQQDPPDIDAKSRAPLDTMPNGSFTSSNVHSAIYDFSEREMWVRYLRDGADAIYQYQDVPAQIWNGLVNADSKGSYLHQYVIGSYRYSKTGLGGFPERGAISNGLLRQFIHAP